MRRIFLLLATLSWALACSGSTGPIPEGFSGPRFEGRVVTEGAIVPNATVTGITYWDDDCDDGDVFSHATTTTDESGEYLLYLDGFAGWDGGVGSELTVLCAELTAEGTPGTDTIIVQAIPVRFLRADTLTLDFSLH